MHQKTIPVRGMHCRSCELVLEEKIGAIQGVCHVKANQKRGLITIVHGDDVPDDREVNHAIEAAGYNVGQTGPLPWISDNMHDWRLVILGTVLLSILYFALRGTGLLSFAVGDQRMTTSFAIILGLIAGVSTCMALVGGLILGISARHAERHPEASAWQKFRPHLFFNLGRVVGYALFGGLLGAIGSTLSPSGTVLAILTIGVGAVMILLGLNLTNISPKLAAVSLTLPPSIARSIGANRHTKEYSHTTSMISGALTFFLPCGFTQAMQLYAISMGDAKTGAIILGAFALGTAPALLGIGGLSSIMKGTRAKIFYATAGVAVLLFGIFNVRNGLGLVPWNSELSGVVGAPTTANTGVQVIEMTQSDSGYSPSRITIKNGIPVRWQITSLSPYTCASSLSVPSLGIRSTLKPGLNLIEFTPTRPGPITFSCSMGMYRGSINVIN